MSNVSFRDANKYCVRCSKSLKFEKKVYGSTICGHQICKNCYFEIDFTVTCFEKSCNKKLHKSEWKPVGSSKTICDGLVESFHSTHLSSTALPNKVKNLKVMSVTTNEINVSWDQPSSGVKPTAYILEQKESGYREWLNIDKIHSDVRNYCFNNLKQNTKYYLRVKSSNDNGISSADEVCQQTKICAPDCPTDIQILDITSSSVTVKWSVRQKSSKPTDFEIKVEEFQYGNIIKFKSTIINQCIITDLKPNCRYAFYIAAKNSGGMSSYVKKMHKTKSSYLQSEEKLTDIKNIEKTKTEDEPITMSARKRSINEETEDQKLINEFFSQNSDLSNKVSRHDIGSNHYDIRGLPNIGMTCYANSILQVLAQTPYLITHLDQLMQKFSLKKESLTGSLLDVLREINIAITDIVKAERLYETVSSNKVVRLVCKVIQSDTSFQIGIQNDSHSFLIAMFNAIKSEIIKGNTEIDALSMFEGTFKSKFTYYPCKHDGVSETQMFTSLLIPIDDDNVSWSIEDGIFSLLKTEKFHCNILPCGKCNDLENETITEKTMEIEHLPDILILQLGKYKQQYRRLEKMNKKVFYSHTLPTNVLKPKTGEHNRQCYRLYGVTLHYGSLSGGHYTAYVSFNQSGLHGDNQWYNCSDSHIQKISKNRVLDDDQAFLLFYYLTDIN